MQKVAQKSNTRPLKKPAPFFVKKGQRRYDASTPFFDSASGHTMANGYGSGIIQRQEAEGSEEAVWKPPRVYSGVSVDFFVDFARNMILQTSSEINQVTITIKTQYGDVSAPGYSVIEGSKASEDTSPERLSQSLKHLYTITHMNAQNSADSGNVDTYVAVFVRDSRGNFRYKSFRPVITETFEKPQGVSTQPISRFHVRDEGAEAIAEIRAVRRLILNTAQELIKENDPTKLENLILSAAPFGLGMIGKLGKLRRLRKVSRIFDSLEEMDEFFKTRKFSSNRVEHSFDRHAGEFFGRQVTREADLVKWGRIVENSAESTKIFKWSVGGSETVAHLARVEGKYLVVQFYKGGPNAGDLATAFVPSSRQLKAMLKALKGS